MACCGSRTQSPISSPAFIRPAARLPRPAASHVDPSYLPLLASVGPRIPCRIYTSAPALRTQKQEMSGFDPFSAIANVVGSIIGAVGGAAAAKENRKTEAQRFEEARTAQLDTWQHEKDIYNEAQETFRLQTEAAEKAREQGIQAGISFARYAVIGGAVLVAFVAVRTLMGGKKGST